MEKIDTPDSSNSVIEKSSSGFGHIAVLYAKRFPLGFLLSFFLTLLQISLDKKFILQIPSATLVHVCVCMVTTRDKICKVQINY